MVCRPQHPPSDASMKTVIVLMQSAQDVDARRVSSLGLWRLA